jgi:hypothetical protein
MSDYRQVYSWPNCHGLTSGCTQTKFGRQCHDVEPKLFQQSNCGEVLIQVRRLRDIARRLIPVGVFNILRVAATREYDYRDVHEAAVALYHRQDCPTVQLRQVQIQEYEMWPGCSRPRRRSAQETQSLFALSYDMNAIRSLRVAQSF